jgi:hypothetical protein
MRKRLAVLTLLMAALAAALVYSYERLPVIQWATRFHAEKDSIDCGYVAGSSCLSDSHANAEAALKCALDANEHHLPFSVIFTGCGIDEQISNAVIGDSRGNAIELVYGTGMVRPRHTLLKHGCKQLQVEQTSPYGFPRLHCAPWPPTRLEEDYILW